MTPFNTNLSKAFCLSAQVCHISVLMELDHNGPWSSCIQTPSNS